LNERFLFAADLLDSVTYF